MRLLLTLVLFYSLSLSFASNASSNLLVEKNSLGKLPSMSLQGSTLYSTFGFALYQAELWSNIDIEPSQQKYSYQAQHLRLNLEYKRNFSKDTLIKSTRKELARVNKPNKHPANIWLQQLNNIWPDIQKGDVLSCLVIPQNKAIFLLNNKEIGEINDPEFGPAFLNIWLSPKTRFKRQARILLGAS